MIFFFWKTGQGGGLFGGSAMYGAGSMFGGGAFGGSSIQPNEMCAPVNVAKPREEKWVFVSQVSRRYLFKITFSFCAGLCLAISRKF